MYDDIFSSKAIKQWRRQQLLGGVHLKAYDHNCQRVHTASVVTFGKQVLCFLAWQPRGSTSKTSEGWRGWRGGGVQALNEFPKDEGCIARGREKAYLSTNERRK